MIIYPLILACPASREGRSSENCCEAPQWKGDGICDDDNNVESCDWDGGDCCGDHVSNVCCHFCDNSVSSYSSRISAWKPRVGTASPYSVVVVALIIII